MSITTSQRFNLDTLQAALPANATCSTAGADPTLAAAKVLTFHGTDDPTGQAALDAAAGQFVDLSANQTTLQQRARAALVANGAYLGITGPTNQQVVAQVNALTKECSTLIRLLLNQLESITGT